MRLLIATPLYPSEPGGPATYARLLEVHLPKRGVEVDVVKFRDVRHLPKAMRHIAYAWRVYTRARNADLILALDPVSVGFPACLAALLTRKKFVLKVVGDYAWEQGVQRAGITDSLDEFVARKNLPLFVALLRAVQTFVAFRATRIIVPSQYLKTIVQAWGLPDERIEVIYNAVEHEEGGVAPTTDLPSPCIVTTGRLVPWKNVDSLIVAIAELGAQGLEPSLVVVGDGPERARLEALAEDQLPGRHVFTGMRSHADTLAAVQQADVFVLNSSYEGLSHALIEALMLGKPTIAADAGGNSELITDGENGMLVPVGDVPALVEALHTVFTDSAYAARIAEAARTRGAHFALDTMVDKTHTLLTRV